MPNTAQTELDGIGQQLATLEDWKKENNIFTHKSWFDDERPWSCWDELESPFDFMDAYGCDAIARGDTEKESILTFCEWNDIKPPFWW